MIKSIPYGHICQSIANRTNIAVIYIYIYMAHMVTHDIWNFCNVQTTKTHFYLRLFLNPNGIKTQIKKNAFDV